MPSPIRIRSKEEKRLIETAHALLDDPAATTADKFKAMGFLERAIRLVEKRRIRRENADLDAYLSEPEPAEPTVDQLVSDLEKTQKPTVIYQQLTDTPNAINAVTAPISASDVPEPTQTVPEAKNDDLAPPAVPAVVFCAFCSATGPWNTRWPAEEPRGVLLCPTCFGKMCSAEMLNATAAARARQETPPDWAADFAGQRNAYSSDFQRSQAIWAEQDRADADRREQEAVERVRLEADLNRQRAEYISRHGQLAPHDNF